MVTCQGGAGGDLPLVWGCPWARLRLLQAGGKAVAPCPARECPAPRRALGFPTCRSAGGRAGGSRERPPPHATLRLVGDLSLSFPPGAPGAARAAAPTRGGAARAGRPPSPAARRQARPRGRGRRASVCPRGAPAVRRRRRQASDKNPLTTKASLFLKAPLAPIQEVEASKRLRAAAAAAAASHSARGWRRRPAGPFPRASARAMRAPGARRPAPPGA